MINPELFNTRLELLRDEYVNNNYTTQTSVGYVLGYLEQLDAERARQFELEFRKGYVFVTDVKWDIKEGDTLKDPESGTEWSVRGIKKHRHKKTSLDHQRVILEK